MRIALLTLLLVMAFVAAGCGGSGRPLAVRDGMTAAQVRLAAGRPAGIRTLSPKEHPPKEHVQCWYYDRTPDGKPIAVAVCFNDGLVAGIDWSYTI